MIKNDFASIKRITYGSVFIIFSKINQVAPNTLKGLIFAEIIFAELKFAELILAELIIHRINFRELRNFGKSTVFFCDLFAFVPFLKFFGREIVELIFRGIDFFCNI